MVWFFLAAAVLLVASFILRSKHPQRALVTAALAVAVGLGGAALYVVERSAPARPDIAPSDLALTRIDVAADRYGAQLRGAVSNRSTSRLGVMTLTIVYRECPSPETCKDLGSEDVRLFMALAASQTGSFSALLTRRDLAALPGVRAEVSVKEAQADF